jgi:adenylosuccinate lyase
MCWIRLWRFSLVASLDVLLARLEDLIAAIRDQAQVHRHTVMIGRSHGIHAEPITFGCQVSWLVGRSIAAPGSPHRLRQEIAVGKISGAVGTYANIEPRVEALACQKLG